MAQTRTVRLRGRSKEAIVRDLEEVRRRTLRLVAPVSDEDLVTQQDPIVSPLNWDLPHIGYFENQWLVHALDGPDARKAHVDPVLEALDNERYERAEKRLPDRAGCVARLEETRARTLDRLDRLEPNPEDPLLAEWFAHEMIINHELQHQENMAMALQFVPQGRYRAPRSGRQPKRGPRPEGMVSVDAGPFPMGIPKRAGTYDNEWPLHTIHVEPFEIDRAPVTNGEFLRFVEDGGYEEPSHWPQDSWDFVGGVGVRHPSPWSRAEDASWRVREFDRERALPLDEPVWGVSWYEAAAYASWAGKRLPTEAEWEMAALWDPVRRVKRVYPWGGRWEEDRANLDQRRFGTTPVGAWPNGVSASGCHQMVGDVWEWTATEFSSYPGFEAFPYREYSEVFFDEGYYVLRGGSWMTHPRIGRGTFRNWAYPHLRHWFAGFRCARSVGGE
jgi:iron(II)-dependent oxidoreductase